MDIDKRIDYSAIVDRKPLKLPDDGRVIVWRLDDGTRRARFTAAPGVDGDGASKSRALSLHSQPSLAGPTDGPPLRCCRSACRPRRPDLANWPLTAGCQPYTMIIKVFSIS